MQKPALASAYSAFVRGVRPPEVLKYSEWVAEYIRLPSTSAVSGKYKPWKFQRLILDAIGDPTIPEVTVQKPTRIGYTRLLCSALAADMVNDPTSVIFVTPTDDDADETVKDEIEPTFTESPEVAHLMTSGRYANGDTLRNRKFQGGGSLKVRSARAPRNLV